MMAVQLFNENAKEIEIDETKSPRRGGGGRVYVCIGGDGGQDCAVKILSPKKADVARQQKLSYLRELGHRHSGLRVAFPTSLLFDKSGVFCGYSMPLINGRSLAGVLGDDLTLQRRVSIARQMFTILRQLHRLAVVAADVHLRNFHITDEGCVWLLDSDSFSVYDRDKAVFYPCREAFIPSPEMIREGGCSAKLTPDSDAYLAAVCAFEVLFAVHPLDDPADCNRRSAIVKNIQSAKFAYLQREESMVPVDYYGAHLADLFRDTFEQRRNVPIGEYIQALLAIESQGFETCAFCGSEFPRLSGGCLCGRHRESADNRCIDRKEDSYKSGSAKKRAKPKLNRLLINLVEVGIGAAASFAAYQMLSSVAISDVVGLTIRDVLAFLGI